MAAVSQFYPSLLFLLLFSLLLVVVVDGFSVERKITSTRQTCPSKICKSQSISIMYIRADDLEQKNIVHFIWSVYETPSIIVAYTSKKHYRKDSNITIDWVKLLSGKEGAITFTIDIDYIMAFEILELHEFDDPKDKVIFPTTAFNAKYHTHSINKTVWGSPHVNGNDITFFGDFLHGNISFQCLAASKVGRDTEAPKQLYSSNGTRFSVSLKNLKLNTTKTRIALKLLTHTKKKANDKTCVMEDQSIDDEYSPGVFRTFVINNTLQNDSELSSMISWKPVSYNMEPRELKTQVPSYQYLYDSNHGYTHTKVNTVCKKDLVLSTEDPPSKVIKAVMGSVETYPVMVSFGQNKDGWYEATDNLIWSGQVGFGTPQFDTISKTVLVTIIVGIGLPVLFIIVGSIYVCVKKYRERKTTSTYGKIN